MLPDGRLAIFHGYFDNVGPIAKDLGTERLDPSWVYGLAVDRWGDEADLRIVGDYCSVVANPERRHLRMARSPLRAPPLYYFHDDHFVVAGSVPRIFFAAGLPQRLNEERVVDSGMLYFLDEEASWFESIKRVPLGCMVELRAGQTRSLKRYYDALAIRPVDVRSDEECISRVNELLDEAVRACLVGFRKPGVTLSAGLDSPQVAARTLSALPSGQKLPTFTFHPESAYDGIVQEGMIGDERPSVETFAKQYPGLEPHYTANEGAGHDHRWNEIFHLMGGAPSGLCNMYVFHGLFAGAAKEGCDVLLQSDWGNNAFSDRGDWAFVEYLLKGKWRQLWLALRHVPGQRRSMAWRLATRCILPLLPAPLWRLLLKAFKSDSPSFRELVQPFTRFYRAQSGFDQRLAKSGLTIDRYHPWNSRQARKALLPREDHEVAEIYQAFEQLYGVPQRDPMAYRPLVEYCWGLPTRMFVRDGEMRWLARRVAQSVMPDEQRTSRLTGRWDADWHLRIGRRRSEYLAEFARLEKNKRIAAMIDIPRLRHALEDWPEHTETDPSKFVPREMAVPRALLTARFVNYVEGRNEQ